MKKTRYTSIGAGKKKTRAQVDVAAARDTATTPKNIGSLIAALASKDVQTRQHARERLVAAGRPAPVPLLEALKDRREMVRWEAAKALQEIADPSAAAAMVTTLEDEDAGVRWLAAEGLIALGRAGVAPLLRALVKRSDSEWLREGAHHVLHTLIRKKWATPLAPVLVALEGMMPHLEAPLAAQNALCTMAETH